MTDREYMITFGYVLNKKIAINKQNKIYPGTQKELSEASGITEAAISKYINALRLPNARNLCRLANALDCTVDELTRFDAETVDRALYIHNMPDLTK